VAYVDKLLGTFQRLHSPGAFAGTGIGLTTSQHIISRYAGHTCTIGAVVGQGALFSSSRLCRARARQPSEGLWSGSAVTAGFFRLEKIRFSYRATRLFLPGRQPFRNYHDDFYTSLRGLIMTVVPEATCAEAALTASSALRPISAAPLRRKAVFPE
jgi:hypothetical protein